MFFRTHEEFRPIVPLVDIEVGMEKQYFAVDDSMVVALAGIGITVSEHTLYLTITPRGGLPHYSDPLHHRERLLPYERDGFARRQEEMGTALYRSGKQSLQGFSGARRTPCRSHLAGIEASKIFRLAFRDKGRLIDSPDTRCS